MALIRATLALALGLLATPGVAQDVVSRDKTATPVPSGAPTTFSPVQEPDVWIFSGLLDDTRESYSGTLVSGPTDTDFELKLADGATCDGSDLKGDVGMVRLSDIACSDGRSLRALFVPQGGGALKVFGHVGDTRFAAEAHLLGTDPLPEQKQTMEPTVPQVLPPGMPGAQP